MKILTKFIVCSLISVVIFSGQAFACGCGGGGKHKHHGGGCGGGGGVGVGVGVDLGGVGQRKREADPFAVGGSSQPTRHTQEKPKSKTKHTEVASSNPLEGVKLTGPEAKSVASAENTASTQPKQ